jgi:hypothetical protein
MRIDGEFCGLAISLCLAPTDPLGKGFQFVWDIMEYHVRHGYHFQVVVIFGDKG